MRKGYVVISIALILLFVTIGITSAVSFLSSGSADISRSLLTGEQAFFSSDGCLEEALLRLKNDPSYDGGTVSFPEGDCHINIDNQSGTYTVKTYFTGLQDYRRGIEAVAEIADGVLQIKSWEEKASVIE